MHHRRRMDALDSVYRVKLSVVRWPASAKFAGQLASRTDGVWTRIFVTGFCLTKV